MHAWLCEDPVGWEALRWTELPTPEPGPGEVRVAVRAASLNFPDLLVVQYKYQVKPPLPFVPGSEYAGVVEAVGADVAGYAPGDAVTVFGGIGGFGTHAVVKPAQLWRLPAGMDFVDGAAFVLTYGTAHHALVDRGQLRPSETVLVLGAAGGVGTASIQVAKALGARVVAAASTADKCAFCREAGADETIDYGAGPLREALDRVLPEGPDLVVDPVGGDLAEPAFRSIAWRGRYLVVGFAGGSIPSLPLNLALLKGASIVGVFWGSFTRREADRHAAAMAELAGWYAQGKVEPKVERTLSMRDLPEACRAMTGRGVRGKLVLVNE